MAKICSFILGLVTGMYLHVLIKQYIAEVEPVKTYDDIIKREG